MFASKSFKKNVFELEILNANTSRLEGWKKRIKRDILGLAIPIPVKE